MAIFNLEESIKRGVEKALSKPICNGLSVLDWAKIGMNSPRWISVKDRLPNIDGLYVVYGQTEAMRELLPDNVPIWMCYYRKELGFYDTEMCRGYDFITHWMPLPEPPKEDNTSGNH